MTDLRRRLLRGLGRRREGMRRTAIEVAGERWRAGGGAAPAFGGGEGRRRGVLVWIAEGGWGRAASDNEDAFGTASAPAPATTSAKALPKCQEQNSSSKGVPQSPLCGAD